jgi:SHS2 domain-containing protein
MGHGTDSGFREVDHTADRRIEAWGPDLQRLLSAAARGMYAICGPETDTSERVTREFQLDAPDRESLLVGFLSELLYRLEAESIALDAFDFDRDGSREEGAVCCRASGHPVLGIDDEIKAVTWEAVFVEEDPEDGLLKGAVTFDI